MASQPGEGAGPSVSRACTAVAVRTRFTARVDPASGDRGCPGRQPGPGRAPAGSSGGATAPGRRSGGREGPAVPGAGDGAGDGAAHPPGRGTGAAAPSGPGGVAGAPGWGLRSIPLIAALLVAAATGWSAGQWWKEASLSSRGAAPGPARLLSQTALAAEPVHVVRPGETLYRIARRYGLTVDELARYNHIDDPTRITAGQRLRIPATARPGQAPGTGAGGRQGRDHAGAGSAGSARPGEAAGGAPAGAPGHGSGSGTPADEGGKAPNPGGDATRGGIVALTFDDGPDPATWPALLAALDRAGVKATFFLEGARAQQHPDLVRELSRRGHQVENHGWSHRSPGELGERATRAEIRRTAAVLGQLTGRAPLYYRPPGGLRDPAVFRWAQAEGHRVLLWTNIGAPDQPPQPPGQLAARVAASAYSGAILMLHATERATVEALPALLDELARRGLRPVTVDQLMQALQAAGAGSSPPAAGAAAPASSGESGST